MGEQEDELEVRRQKRRVRPSEVARRKAQLAEAEEARRQLRAEDFLEPPPLIGGVEFLEADYGDQQWSVQELLVRGGNPLLAGQFKSGKTVLNLNLVRALVDDVPFLGRFATRLSRGARVGYFNYELTDQQMQGWLRRLGIKNLDQLAVANLRGHRLRLADPEAADWAARWLDEWEVEWWFIDPFARAYGGPENDNSEVGLFAEAVDVIKQEAGVEVAVLAAHFGRQSFEPGTEHGRGATRLDDWADSRWILTRDGDERFFAAPDVRGGEPVREGRLLFDPETLHLTLVEGGRVQRKAEAVEGKVLAHVRAVCERYKSGDLLRQKTTSNAVMEAIDARATDVRNALKALAERGSLVVVSGPNNARYHVLPGYQEQLW